MRFLWLGNNFLFFQPKLPAEYENVDYDSCESDEEEFLDDYEEEEEDFYYDNWAA